MGTVHIRDRGMICKNRGLTELKPFGTIVQTQGDANLKKSKTPTFLMELPLVVNPGQAKRLRAHFEATRFLIQRTAG
jgi:hypothetical protein